MLVVCQLIGAQGGGGLASDRGGVIPQPSGNAPAYDQYKRLFCVLKNYCFELLFCRIIYTLYSSIIIISVFLLKYCVCTITQFE